MIIELLKNSCFCGDGGSGCGAMSSVFPLSFDRNFHSRILLLNTRLIGEFAIRKIRKTKKDKKMKSHVTSVVKTYT